MEMLNLPALQYQKNRTSYFQKIRNEGIEPCDNILICTRRASYVCSLCFHSGKHYENIVCTGDFERTSITKHSSIGFIFVLTLSDQEAEHFYIVTRAIAEFVSRTPLHCACSPHYTSTSGHAEVAHMLLETGGDQLAFSRDEQGNTALHVAASNAEDTVAKLLALYYPGLLHVRNSRNRFIARSRKKV